MWFWIQGSIFKHPCNLRAFIQLRKETDVTQGVIPLKCKTSLGCSVTAGLDNVIFRNVCKASSIGHAALCWCWLKAGAQDPTSPSARAVFAGHAQCQVVPDVFVHRSQDDNISCQRIGLCPSVPGISHVTGPPFSCCSAMPLWDNPIWMCQIFPQALLLTSSCSQSLELGVDSRAQLFRERWSQKNGFSSSLRLAHTALLSGLFSSLHWQWSLSLCHV